jgi:iron complex transport system permease protein
MTVFPSTTPARRAARGLGLLLLLAALLGLVLASISLGSRPIPLARLWQLLWQPDGSVESAIVWQMRMPRTALGLAVGAALGVAGGLMQALTRNPLADPGLLGINAGAALAVMLAAVGVYLLSSGAAPSAQRVRLLLAGMAISASLGSCTGIITLFDSNTFDAYRFWVVGALDGRNADVLWPMLPLVLAGIIIALWQARALDAIALGDEFGQALGLRLKPVRVWSFIAIALLCGAATAAAGPIAFVGLVIPHAVRLLVGPHWRWILPYGLLAGPVLVLGSDIVGRLIAVPSEIEVGIVTAFIGAPVLLALVQRSRHGSAV